MCFKNLNIRISNLFRISNFVLRISVRLNYWIATMSYAINSSRLGEGRAVAGTAGPVAQRLEQWTHNPLVVGSNPTGPSTLALLQLGFEPIKRSGKRIFPGRRGDRQLCCRQRGRATMEICVSKFRFQAEGRNPTGPICHIFSPQLGVYPPFVWRVGGFLFG